VPRPAPPRSKGEQKLIADIQKFVAAKGLAAPDLTYALKSELKAAYADLKAEAKRRAYAAKVAAFAAKKGYSLANTDLNAMTLEELKSLKAAIRKAPVPA
jgi:hypothetical protein